MPLICQLSPNFGPTQSASEFDKAYHSIMGRWNSWEQILFAFLKSHTCGAIYSTPNPKVDATKFNTQIRVMVQLYFCLSKFVNFYPIFVRSNAARTRPVFPPKNHLGQRTQEGQEWRDLTDTELLRLQRGLLRYELFCRVVGLSSISANCNERVYDQIVADKPSSVCYMWVENPFTDLLPIDEVEEIICASIYVRDLYQSLQWDILREFDNHVLELSTGHGRSVPERNATDTLKTTRSWLSQEQALFFTSVSWKPDNMFDWTERMSRLGLVFLDRLIKSTVEDRRELMRNAFNGLMHKPLQYRFLWRYWDDVRHDVRSAPGRTEFEVGPYCNTMILTSSINDSVAESIDIDGAHHLLRRLGWVFFDDRSKIQSLGLPCDANASTIRDWLEKPENKGGNGFPRLPRISDLALTARFTEQEWKELVIGKYSLKDRRSDYQAMSQFVAGARAVVDFTSTQLPHLD